MIVKNLKARMASFGLSLVLVGGPSVAMAMPVFADDDVVNEIEMTLDEEQKEEPVVEEKQEVQVQEEKEEVVTEEKTEEPIVEEVQEVVEEPVMTTSAVQENIEEVVEEEKTEEVTNENAQSNEATIPAQTATATNETTTPTNETTTNETPNEEHKVSVITVKVDGDGNSLVGATLQILDKDGNVVDEWVSDGTEHISMLPEGEYTLHEANAPEGYVAAEDKPFTVKVEVNDINADVEHDDSHDVCWHYGGVPLYYIESHGEREEVYCINQDWDEPNGIDYNGVVLNESNIRTFTPDSDTSMSDTALYNKVLDIIYHRSKAEELFPNLSEVEIRFITEYALKTFTSAEVTTRQAMRDENGHLIRDDDGNLVYEDVKFLRQFRYDPNSSTGYVEDRGNGDGLGKLAQHWWSAHNHTKIPAEYAELFYYLVNDLEKHPEDMHLYIYSTKNMTADGESYQNLLGVRWFNPYDENYQVYLSLINEGKPYVPPEEPDKPDVPDKPDKPEKPEKPTKVEKTVAKVSRNTPETGDNNHIFEWALAGLGSAAGLIVLGTKRKENQKVKVK